MKRYGLLGEKLLHSFSPQIHNLLGDYEYLLYEKSPSEIKNFMRCTELDGFNVTIPYKRTVLPYCQELSARARALGNVNTIVRRTDGTLYGDNTDYYGFSYLLTKSDRRVRGQKAIILGSGGASKTVKAVLHHMGADPVVTISRTGENNYSNIFLHYDTDLIVNTTPVGMVPNTGKAPVDLGKFKRSTMVIDLIYNPAQTELLLQAREYGMPYLNGLSMLVAQAKRASEIFCGQMIPDSEIERITDIISGRMQNIVLIGMPGCGKSSVGVELAALTGRPFYDTDEIVVDMAGKPIPQIFALEGEKTFRDLETAALEKVAKGSGAVIATGGGVVTEPRNIKLIMQNSIAVFLERDMYELPTANRPISQNRSIIDIFSERIPLYRSWSNYTFKCRGVSETANQIKESLRL